MEKFILLGTVVVFLWAFLLALTIVTIALIKLTKQTFKEFKNIPETPGKVEYEKHYKVNTSYNNGNVKPPNSQVRIGSELFLYAAQNKKGKKGAEVDNKKGDNACRL